MTNTVKLIVALDGMAQDPQKLANIIGAVEGVSDKVVLKANDLMAQVGLRGMREIETPCPWMVDGKWHDIPATVGNYMSLLGELSPEIVTIHASGGADMIHAAVSTRKYVCPGTRIFAITALTGMTNTDTMPVYGADRSFTALRLAREALHAGVDGLVCSPQEGRMLRAVFGRSFPDMKLLTPGIRFDGGATVVGDDQNNVDTPEGAVRAGSNYLVVGRPITRAEHPAEVVRGILSRIADVVPEVPDGRAYEFERLLMEGSWEELLQHLGAIYVAREGGTHVRYTSGLIADRYTNVGGVLDRNPLVLDRAAYELGLELRGAPVPLLPDYFVGAQMGSVRFSGMFGAYFAGVPSIYLEKDGSGKQYEGVGMSFKRHDVDLRGKKVVITEDLTTKGETAEAIKKAVEARGGEVIAILAIANNTGDTARTEMFGVPYFACYNVPKAKLYWDGKTPEDRRKDLPRLPDGIEVEEDAKKHWAALTAQIS